jgi:hypothetical protein
LVYADKLEVLYDIEKTKNYPQAHISYVDPKFLEQNTPTLIRASVQYAASAHLRKDAKLMKTSAVGCILQAERTL